MRAIVLEHWAPLAERTGLVLHDFDGGIELRIPGRDKGFVVKTILAELGSGAAVAYLGDDLTDEDAFMALNTHGLSAQVRQTMAEQDARVVAVYYGEMYLGLVSMEDIAEAFAVMAFLQRQQEARKAEEARARS